MFIGSKIKTKPTGPSILVASSKTEYKTSLAKLLSLRSTNPILLSILLALMTIIHALNVADKVNCSILVNLGNSRSSDIRDFNNTTSNDTITDYNNYHSESLHNSHQHHHRSIGSSEVTIDKSDGGSTTATRIEPASTSTAAISEADKLTAATKVDPSKLESHSLSGSQSTNRNKDSSGHSSNQDQEEDTTLTVDYERQGYDMSVTASPLVTSRHPTDAPTATNLMLLATRTTPSIETVSNSSGGRDLSIETPQANYNFESRQISQAATDNNGTDDAKVSSTLATPVSVVTINSLRGQTLTTSTGPSVNQAEKSSDNLNLRGDKPIDRNAFESAQDINRSMGLKVDDDPLISLESRDFLSGRENGYNEPKVSSPIMPKFASSNYRPGQDETLDSATKEILKVLFKKKPYSKFWPVEQRWDDLFKRFVSVQDSLKNILVKNMLRDVEYYADISISQKCADDIRYVQEYAKKSTNFRWLMHMFDSMGKSEPGMLTGNLAHLGHVVQCIKVRAPARPSNDTFEEQYFEKQTRVLGERFRGKYCLASIRPVMPKRPHLVSRFTESLDRSLLSNVSFMGGPNHMLKQRINDVSLHEYVHQQIDRQHYRIDDLPFESELYQYIIDQRDFMYSLPRFLGVCYPSSCSREDIQASLQKTLNEHHQVVDIEFECEQEEHSAWSWFITPRLIAYVIMFLIITVISTASLVRYILVDKLQLRKKLSKDPSMNNVFKTLDILSMDKCAGTLFIKTHVASPLVDRSKHENSRSDAIDALKGFMILVLIYSEIIYLGCLPVPFMWSKWADAMFPFHRSLMSQVFLNSAIWSEAFYIISAYLIGAKFLESNRPRTKNGYIKAGRSPDFSSYAMRRYIRLLLPMIPFMLLNYVWPRLSNGFVMQDQAKKLMTPCDNHGWTNMLMFHNRHSLNETCLWPSHVSASFFQLHLLTYPILMLFLFSMRTMIESVGTRKFIYYILTISGFVSVASLALFGAIYPALLASNQELIVPFLIDYIDYDNYQRVIEWMVLPTYNHLTSYMFGLVLAYIVVRRRVQHDMRHSLGELVPWHGENYTNRESSLESVNTSSTQELQLNAQASFIGRIDSLQPDRLPGIKYNTNLQSIDSDSFSAATITTASTFYGLSSTIKVLKLVATSGLFVFIGFITLSSSWYWNGLGQPMSPRQTFWYIVITKLVYSSVFSYLFYKHFATRRNSITPYMITRFLAPIGRMSLTVFYVSWIVIWFDLLASLYQWHPSHYFVFEKFTEIIFMTLITSMLSYGAFEGVQKSLGYGSKKSKADQIPPTSLKEAERNHGFDRWFEPLYHPGREVKHSENSKNISKDVRGQNQEDSAKELGNKMISKVIIGRSTPTGLDKDRDWRQQAYLKDHQLQNRAVKASQTTIGDIASAAASSNIVTTSNLSHCRPKNLADRYKLNAELRANYSFASIGLYEAASATGELSQDGSRSESPIVNRK